MCIRDRSRGAWISVGFGMGQQGEGAQAQVAVCRPLAGAKDRLIRKVQAIASVSYTHLDVYKRQELKCSQNPCFSSNRNSSTAWRPGSGVDKV